MGTKRRTTEHEVRALTAARDGVVAELGETLPKLRFDESGVRVRVHKGDGGLELDVDVVDTTPYALDDVVGFLGVLGVEPHNIHVPTDYDTEVTAEI